MSNRHDPQRRARVRDRDADRATLRVLLGRLDRLSPAEAALLLEYVDAELTASDALRDSLVGLERSQQQTHARIRAAEAAIVEAEQDRDEARQQLDEAERRARTVLGQLRHQLEVAQHDRTRAVGEAREARGLLNAALVRARKAEVALDDVRSTLDAIERDRARLSPENESFGDGYADAAARIRIALDDQPKELAP